MGMVAKADQVDFMDIKSLGVYLAKVLIVATCYAVSGRLGLYLAVPPGYATVIWPPSGIAIGALFILGASVWPGVLLGSFLVNCYIAGAYSPDAGFDSIKMAVAFTIALGSTWQVLVAHLLVRRFSGLPIQINSLKDVLRLVIMTGPLPCLIAASVGVCSLYMAGVVSGEAFFQNWLTWWTGDLFGVLVFLPLILLAPGPQRVSWRGRTLGNLPISSLLVLLIPLVLTFYAWKVSTESAFEKGQIQFHSLTVETKKALFDRLTSYDNALVSGTAYFQGSQNVTRSEWRQYVNVLNLHKSFPGINGIGWIAPHTTESLPAFVREMRSGGAQKFNVHPETDADVHYVISYIEPEQANLQAIGLDIAFETNRKAAADLARDSGQSAMTKRIVLVQDNAKTPGFLLLHPMYRSGAPKATELQRRGAFQGWIYAPFVAKNFMKNLTGSQANTVRLRVYDGTTQDEAALIYDSGPDRGDDSNPVFSKVEQIEVMQQNWYVLMESTLPFEYNAKSDNPLIILVSGILFTILFGLFLFFTTLRDNDAVEAIDGKKAFLLPSAVFIILITGSVSLYNSLETKEQTYIKTLISSETTKMELLLKFQTEAKLQALDRMASRWELAGGTPLHIWRGDARNYISEMVGLEALELRTRDYNVITRERLASSNYEYSDDHIAWTIPPEELDNMARTGLQVASAPFALSNRDPAFEIRTPLKIDGTVDGYLVSLFSVEGFFGGAISADASAHYQFEVNFETTSVYTFGSVDDEAALDWTIKTPIRLYDKNWNISISPTKAFLASQRTPLPDLVLIAGLVIAMLSAIVAHASVNSRLKTRYLEKSNRRIKRESTHNSTVMNTVLDGLLTVSATGTIETINSAGLRMFGYALNELIGRDFQVLMHAPDNDSEEIGYFGKSGGASEIASERQFTGRRKDGSIFPMDLSVNEMVLDGTCSFVATIRDTSQAVAAERALRESNMMKSAVLKSTAYMIVATDLQGRVILYNDAAEQNLGYSAAEVIGKATPALWRDPEELRLRNAELDKELGTVGAAGFSTLVRKVDIFGIDEYECTTIRKDGTRFPTAVTVTSMHDEKNGVKGYLGVMVDLTKRKEVDRLKNEFVSIISHELRTPLTSIRGSLGLVVGTMSKDLPDKAKRLLDIAHKNCERLTVLINDILDIDKIASGKMRFDMKKENLLGMLENAVEVNQPYAEKYGVDIRLSPVDERLEIKVDAERFAQVLANLLSNAAKFSDQSDYVTLDAGLNGDRIRITVEDKGQGIPQEFQSQIFGKFLQSDSSSTRVKGGSGLGLHITKQIVEKMGGEIGFTTEEGKGTRFWVEFAMAVETPDTASDMILEAQGSYDSDTRAIPTVLHVEDDDDLRRMLALSLQGQVQMVPVGSLKAAQVLLSQQRFDMMVLDIGMPDGSGLELLELKDWMDIPEMPIMLLTANEVPEDVRRRVAAVVTKSRVSEARIVETILSILSAKSKTKFAGEAPIRTTRSPEFT